MRELDATQARGFAISRAEFSTGVTTLAAPVFDADGAVRYVLQCPGLEADVPSRKHDVAAPLLQAAERIGIMLRNAAA